MCACCFGVELTRAGFDIVGEAGDGREATRVLPRGVARCRGTGPVDAGSERLRVDRAVARPRPGIAIVAYSAVAGEFVRREMARLAVPLLLKSGNMAPLVDKLRELVRSA